MTTAEITAIDISKPLVMAGLLLGGMLPFLFSSLAMDAVGKAAMEMIQEVRRQFKSIPELNAALQVMKQNEGKEFEEWSDADKKTFYREEMEAAKNDETIIKMRVKGERLQV